MLSINTNLSSLIAQRSMKQSTNKLNQAIERMTTGAKINHAKDNAANYNIATNMTTKLGALQVAEDNALQGLEMINTTSETLSLIEDKLSRMRALSVQALNGSYGEKSLSAINSEAESLLNEITRLNDSATYNGIKLFNTGKKEVTNAGKELELNEQGFLQEVVRVDTSGMTKLSSVDPNATLAVGEYSISTPEELAQLAEMTNAGLVEAGSTFTLANDIDIGAWCRANEANGGWIPIKLSGSNFNGNGYTIVNLYINRNSSNQALFYGAQNIKNLKLLNCNIKGKDYVAGISAKEADITNCSVKGSIEGENFTAGLMGSTYYADTSFCYFKGSVKGNNNVGGIVSFNNYSYSDHCFVEGFVQGVNNVGGISGQSGVRQSRCSAIVTGVSVVGGIVGSSNATYHELCFQGKVFGQEKVGGIVGEQYNYTSLNAGNGGWIMEGDVEGNLETGVFIGYCPLDLTVSGQLYYYAKNISNLDIVGSALSVSIANEPLDITIPCDYTLQIGSSGDNKTSTVSCTTYIDFGQLNNVLSSGIESTDSIEKIEELVKIAELKQVELGTVQNRLTSVLEEISTQYENLVSSRSTLQDADIAEVSSEYIRQQILQQASATLMATANQSPSIALQLI